MTLSRSGADVLKRVLVSAGLIRGAYEPETLDKLLMSRRLEGAHLAGSWEFPGGKVELGEDPREALARELREELNIEVSVGQIYAVGHHAYPEKDVVLLIYECWHTGGVPEALEVAEFSWLTPHEVCALPLPPADEEVITRLSQEVKLTQNHPSQPSPRATSHLRQRSSLGQLALKEGALSATLHGLEDTHELGARFGRLLREAYQAQRDQVGPSYLLKLPLVIASHGDLGAGKTSLAQGVARGLGVARSAYVNSPTFSLLQSHAVEGDDELFFHHLDLYRLEDEDELDSLGFDEVLADGIGFVEWPTRGPKLFQGPHWRVSLHYPDEYADHRLLTLELIGEERDRVAPIMAEVLAQLSDHREGEG